MLAGTPLNDTAIEEETKIDTVRYVEELTNMSNKYTSNLKKKEQKKEGAYSYRTKSGNKTASYDTTSSSATRKTTGVDKGGLQSNRKENRGRPKADAPRGKRKQHTKYEHTKKTTKKGRK